jgi:hypothetical protein
MIFSKATPHLSLLISLFGIHANTSQENKFELRKFLSGATGNVLEILVS